MRSAALISYAHTHTHMRDWNDPYGFPQFQNHARTLKFRNKAAAAADRLYALFYSFSNNHKFMHRAHFKLANALARIDPKKYLPHTHTP